MQVNLRRIPFFSALPDDVLQAIGSRLRLESYAKDNEGSAQGEEGQARYIIEAGQVKALG